MFSPGVVLITLFLSSVCGQLNMRNNAGGSGYSGPTMNEPSARQRYAQVPRPNSYGDAKPGQSFTVDTNAEKRQTYDYYNNPARIELVENGIGGPPDLSAYIDRQCNNLVPFWHRDPCRAGIIQGFHKARQARYERVINKHQEYFKNNNLGDIKPKWHWGYNDYGVNYQIWGISEEIIQQAKIEDESGNITDGYYLLDLANRFLDYSVKTADIVSGLIPITSWPRSVVEAINGFDIFTGITLSPFERNMAIWDAVTFGSILAPCKGIRLLSKLAKVDFSRLIDLHDKLGSSKLNQIFNFVRKHKIYGGSDKKALDISEAFMKDAKVRTLVEDLPVVRYFDPKFSFARGNWVTPKPLANPEVELALEHAGEYQMKHWTIPKGTEILEGKVAPNWQKTGGADQILVDARVLK